MTEFDALVLAAGRGTRMKSPLPKVLHSLAGRPLVYYPVRAALDLGARRVVVVVSPDAREVVATVLERHLPGAPLLFAVQEEPRGTGDAAKSGLSAGSGAGRVLLLYGDTPLLQASDLAPVLEPLASGAALSLLTFQ